VLNIFHIVAMFIVVTFRTVFHTECSLRRGSAVGRLLGLWVRIPPEARMFVPCECCVLRGKMSLRWTVHSSIGTLQSVVCLSDCEAWILGGHGPTRGRNPTKKNCLMNLLTTFHLHTWSGLLFLAVISRRGKFFARSPCYFTFCKMFRHTRRQHGEPISLFFLRGGGGGGGIMLI
jgi:hypothetical protein